MLKRRRISMLKEILATFEDILHEGDVWLHLRALLVTVLGEVSPRTCYGIHQGDETA
jgi:hypothetical protein